MFVIKFIWILMSIRFCLDVAIKIVTTTPTMVDNEKRAAFEIS